MSNIVVADCLDRYKVHHGDRIAVEFGYRLHHMSHYIHSMNSMHSIGRAVGQVLWKMYKVEIRNM